MKFNKELRSILENIPVYSNYSGQSLASLIDNKSPFYIPLCEETLSSEFCRGVTWGVIIGDPKKITEKVSFENISIVPVYIKPYINSKREIYLNVNFQFEPSIRRRIRVNNCGYDNPHKELTLGSKRKYKPFHFNGSFYDISALQTSMPMMSKDELYDLKSRIVKDLYLIINVEYIVTDTNNWCTETADKTDLKYAPVLGRIAEYIIKKGFSTKFLVISEILTELKRLAKKYWAARKAQRLLNDSFMPRNLIYIPNPQDDIAQDVIADSYIQKQVLKLYEEGIRQSVISNDQQAMMLFQASIDNATKNKKKYYPNFLSLENIDNLFELLNMISNYQIK